MASLGLPFTVTKISGRAALAGCQPDLAAFRDDAAMHPGALDFAQFAYARGGGTFHTKAFREKPESQIVAKRSAPLNRCTRSAYS